MPLLKAKNDNSSSETSTLRLMKCKLAQRIGMVYLKPRLVTWAYQKSQKSLTDNIKKTTGKYTLQVHGKTYASTSVNLQTNKMDIENTV